MINKKIYTCPVCGKEVRHNRFIYDNDHYCNLLCFLQRKLVKTTKKAESDVAEEPKTVIDIMQPQTVVDKPAVEEIKTVVEETKTEEPVSETPVVTKPKTTTKKKTTTKSTTTNSAKVTTKKTTTKKSATTENE